jgi:hypothetical protein
VTFVRDYLQLQFDPPPSFNVYTPVVVGSGATVAALGTDAFPALIVGQINKRVARVIFSEETDLTISFVDASVVTISLRRDDYRGAEAVNLFCANGDLIVV